VVFWSSYCQNHNIGNIFFPQKHHVKIRIDFFDNEVGDELLYIDFQKIVVVEVVLPDEVFGEKQRYLYFLSSDRKRLSFISYFSMF